MEREPEHLENVEMPKFCPECGGEMIELFKIPNEIIVGDEPYEAWMDVCTMCDYEESAEYETIFDELSRDQWREINNALPDVTLPQKVEIQSSVRVLGHEPFPPEYLHLYSHLLIAELVAQKLRKAAK